ncbi:MAG: carboxypeptidase regulatory-like domain-containing protein [Paludibacteraceae bacterium]|nr:carboxypeptidase regulatory-like domain-containing protein [Paludibacteraceae bacterium]MBP3576055.1 carboxypeptidase regulatory-like domain-containing protein [Paludibacteraceae bacterium]
MKKTFLLFFTLISLTNFAADRRVYINPGHGSWCANCRPMATIPYPNLSSTGMPDTLGFYESNTNLWKGLYLRDKLQEAGGYTVFMSRTANGPAGSTSTANNKYNRSLSEICEEVEANNIDYFISIHSNAATEGTNTNYPIILYRGTDSSEKVTGSKARANASWDRLKEINTSGFEYYTSYTNSRNVRGDISFYNSSSSYGYLGVLKHSAPGFLSEGYFHTYQPARHRALNPDWCCQEGLRYFRGIVDYFGTTKDDKGYIMGAVRTKEKSINHSLYTYNSKTNDKYAPIHGAKIVLRNASGDVIKTDCYHYVKRMLKNQDYYTTDNNYNGIFVFENLTPGKYTLTVHAKGYKDYTQTVTVTANTTTYPQIFLESGQGTEPNINVDIKWVLNGGIVIGGDVPTNEELWETFKPYYNTYYGLNRADQTIENVATFANAYMQDIMTNSKSDYKWLGDYILSVAGALDGESAWRWHVHAFFNCNDGTVKGNQKIATADFSQAGKPEAWGESYQIAMGTSATLPSSVKETYTLPTPKKDGDVFIGWYNNPRGDGNPITSIPAGYKGTIYAIWQNENPDSDKEINIVTWVLNGGIVPGGDVPSNADLWDTFKPYYNTYYGLNRADQTIENVATFANAYMQDIMTNSKSDYKWLGDYILSVAGTLDGESAWRWHVHAFFNCNDGTVKGNQKIATADFSQAGKPEAWGTAYQIAMGTTGELPTTIDQPYTLPTPVKEGYIFVGWYDNPEGTGTPLTILPKGYVGTIYAIWKQETPNAVENITLPIDHHAPMYDVLGRQVDCTYRGIVIQNGQTYLLR